MNVTRNIKVLLITAILLLTAGSLLAQSQEVLFKAMQDGLNRNMNKLVMEDLDRPYFISYTIDDYQALTTTGSLGSLLRSNLDRSRYLTVDVRVGDYSLDNSNFVSGWGDMTPSYRRIPVDNNYDAIRNQIYLATDEAYKSVLRTLSRKKAYLQTRVLKNRPDDFFKLPVNHQMDKPEQYDVDKPAIEELVKSASAVLRDYPEIVSSQLKAEVGVDNQYFLNSLGSKTLRGDRTYVFELSLSGKDQDGEDVAYSDRLMANKMSDLPHKQKLTEWTRKAAETLKSMIKADTVEEYIGPVIFTGEAAGEFFRQLFAKNVSNAPSPVFEDDRFGNLISSPEFANKINRRVLPDFFDVYDDPTISEYDGMKLMGHYDVDDAGGVPERIQLVEKGKLRTLPIGEAPTKKVAEPNGHARGAVSKEITGKPANLIFESSDAVSYDSLKKSMLDLCQDIDLDYGLVIKKIRDLNSPSPNSGFSFYGMSRGNDQGLTAPLEVYKVYADGREELVRGLEFAHVTVRLLRDILQTDNQQQVYNYLIGDDYEMPASIVCPSVLLEEVELKQGEAKNQKPPIVSSPLSEK
jgi:TldD protein